MNRCLYARPRTVVTLSSLLLLLAALPAFARVTLVRPSSGPADGSFAPAFDMRNTTSSLEEAAMIFEDLPDSLAEFRVHQQKIRFRVGNHALLWFEIRWRTADGTDLLVNEGYFDADDSITLPYRVPSSRSGGCRFRAYLSTERTRQTQVWFGETRLIGVRSHPLTFSISARPSRSTAAVGDSLSVAVAVAWTPDSGEVFPYLFCDLVDGEHRLYARAIGYDVSRTTSGFVFPYHLTERAADLQLRARCYVTDGFDPDGPLLAESESVPIEVAPFDSGAGSRQMLTLGGGGFYRDRLPLFLFGVDLVSNWTTWDSTTIVRQIETMAKHGLNYVRLWWDWSSYETAPGSFSSTLKQKIALFLRESERRGIFIEPVPVGNWGGWIFDMYRDHWWADSVNRAAQYRYYFDVAKTILETGVRNIAYISLMQEGSYSFDWFDPQHPLGGWVTYPGPLDSAEAIADWRAWLRVNGRPENWTYDSSVVEWGRWASERFNDLIALRRKAIRDASGTAFRVGLEGGQGGFDYDRRIPGHEPAYYLKPERWCHLVDVAEIHNYVPTGFSGYWSYENGIASYVRLMQRFGVVSNVGEYQFTWAGSVNNDSLPWAWDQLRIKAGKLRDLDVAGCALWSWADYDDRRFGLEDRSLRPRPILDSLAGWLATWLPEYRRDRVTVALWNYRARMENPRIEPLGTVAATAVDQYGADPTRYRSLVIPLWITQCRRDLDTVVVSGTYDSTALRFLGTTTPGEFGEAPTAPGFRTIRSSVQPAAGSLHRFTISVGGPSPLPFPSTNSAGCLLDTLPLVFLQFQVLARSSARPVIAIDSGSGVYASNSATRLALRRGGADSVETGMSGRQGGAGRVAIRTYDRPRLVPIPDSSYSRISPYRYRARTPLTLQSGSTDVRQLLVTLRDSVAGSRVPRLSGGSSATWVQVSQAASDAGLPACLPPVPTDANLTVAFDPAEAARQGDTTDRTIALTFSHFELKSDLTLEFPVTWRSTLGAPDVRPIGAVSVVPNPAAPLATIDLRGAEGPISLTYYSVDGRRIEPERVGAGRFRAPIDPGIYWVIIVGRNGTHVERLIVAH